MDLIEWARKQRPILEKLSKKLEDSEAVECAWIFPLWKAEGKYSAGQRVQYNGTLYSCLQEHTAQAGWAPDAAPSLWAKVLISDPDTVPEWEQPESTNPYMMGDKVTHNGKTWTSSIDNNVWEPGVYGWEENLP